MKPSFPLLILPPSNPRSPLSDCYLYCGFCP